MAIKLGISGTTTDQVSVAGSKTVVRKVVIGTPVRRVTSGAISINSLSGVTTAGAITGSLLIYDATAGQWAPTQQLEEQNINGGQY